MDSRPDPKAVLLELQRLKAQNERLRQELADRERNLRARENQASNDSPAETLEPPTPHQEMSDLATSDAISRAQEPASTSYSDTRTADSTSTSGAPLETAPAQSKAPAQSSPPAFLQFPSHAATEREAAQVITAAPASSGATQASVQKGRQGAAAPTVEQAETPLDIVFVSAEVAPWSKTGGLGDVVGSLPIALAARGHRVMVIAPRYMNGKSDKLYEGAFDTGCRVNLDMGACGQQEVAFFHQHSDHVDWVFVDHPSYHRPGNPYQDENGVFGDNQFRYALLSLAACEAPLQLNIGGFRSGEPPGFPYGDKVVFVANDWHAGLVPSYIAGRYRRAGVYKDARCIFAIHNLSHQGVEPAASFGNFGLPDDWYDPLSWEYPSWASINGPAVNILKGALVASDRIVTVSQGYAWEITTPEGGWGLHGVLQARQHVLNGITNGVDTTEWDPETDAHTAASFSPADLRGKAECKAALQAELGFEVNHEVPLIGWIGRLDHQKGPDVALDAIPGLAARGCQFVMLGSGDAEYENAMRAAEAQHPASFRGWVGFSVPVAHRIIAGCDILLMPSRFEPCGLNQLFAMRYGTIPIAHATGGLRDTIQDYSPYASDDAGKGTGWTFSPPDAAAMLRAVDAALEVRWHRPDEWQAIMRNGMTADLSWNRAALQYEQIFSWALMDQPVRPW
ncbi:Soluble starch synthase 1, chloroplastic/amyloplastic [Coccomyxa sp. Obi]|nr:Soluble starch synthase 1, chloroplastic/amyloplastic [Coccomyxa sp. Obi]